MAFPTLNDIGSIPYLYKLKVNGSAIDYLSEVQKTPLVDNFIDDGFSHLRTCCLN